MYPRSASFLEIVEYEAPSESMTLMSSRSSLGRRAILPLRRLPESWEEGWDLALAQGAFRAGEAGDWERVWVMVGPVFSIESSCINLVFWI